jgi:hypothetical protein
VAQEALGQLALLAMLEAEAVVLAEVVASYLLYIKL